MRLTLLLLPLLFCACPPAYPTLAGDLSDPPPADEDFIYYPYEPTEVQRPDTVVFQRPRGQKAEFYYPDTAVIRALPRRFLRVNFHVMNTTDTLYDFHGERARRYLLDLMNYANALVSTPRQSYLSSDSLPVPALPTQLRFELVKKPGTDEHAIYEHYDDDLYWYLHDGRQRNLSDRTVISRYGVDVKNILNVFVMGPPRDSLTSPTFQLPNAKGVYLGNAIKITGLLASDRPAWEHRGNLVHEFGHALGLAHAWGNDGCDDTPRHANDYWRRSPKNRGPGKTSNNLMDYSNLQEALTPCQIGRMHLRMSDITGKQRGWLVPHWCRLNPNEPVRIDKDLNWEGARDFNTHLFVRRGATLRINNRVHLPAGGQIYVDPGGRLELGPKAVLHNSCGEVWGGILVGVTESGYAGAVVADSAAVIVNIQP